MKFSALRSVAICQHLNANAKETDRRTERERKWSSHNAETFLESKINTGGGDTEIAFGKNVAFCHK